MLALCFSETSASFYQTTQSYVPEVSNLQMFVRFRVIRSPTLKSIQNRVCMSSLRPWTLRIWSLATCIIVFLFVPRCKLNESPGMNPDCFLIFVYQVPDSDALKFAFGWLELRFVFARPCLFERFYFTIFPYFVQTVAVIMLQVRPLFLAIPFFDVVWSEQLKAYLNKSLMRS